MLNQSCTELKKYCLKNIFRNPPMLFLPFISYHRHYDFFQIYITYRSKNNLEEIKSKLQQNTTLGEKGQVTEGRKTKSVFRAPVASHLPDRSKILRNKNNILKPTLVKQFKNKEIKYKLIKVLRSKKSNKTSHLVLKLEVKKAY